LPATVQTGGVFTKQTSRTTVSVTAKPEVDADVIGPVVSPALAGTFENSTATVNLTFSAGGVFFIEARATFTLP